MSSKLRVLEATEVELSENLEVVEEVQLQQGFDLFYQTRTLESGNRTVEIIRTPSG